MNDSQTPQIQFWPIDKLVFYARNPRKDDAAVDRLFDEFDALGAHRTQATTSARFAAC